MHEMGIANSVLQAVQKELALHRGTYATKVGVRIGEMAAVDQDALRFCFEAITRETEFESLRLEIEISPFRFRCSNCDKEFVVRDYETRCPQCASLETKFVSGDELELAFLEVEEYGTSTVGAKST